MITTIECEAADETMPITALCVAMGASRATVYRHREGSASAPETGEAAELTEGDDEPIDVALLTEGDDESIDVALLLEDRRRRRSSPRALSPAERQELLDLCHREDNVDKSPEAILAELLDQGRYLCSVRTARRILVAAGEIKERRPQRAHPTYARPELMATGPRQVWTWDITYLRGPRKGVYYYLYVILDIYSRYVVGWLLGQVESTDLAHQLIEEIFRKEGVLPGELVLHADRGSVPASTGLDKLFEDLGLTRSHSRPRVSNDNPYSESFFRTGKYRPDYPGRFVDFEHALAWCRAFFPWYNDQHRHSGICYLPPSMVHHGRAEAVLEVHAKALREGYERHPERFVHGPPTRPQLPAAVYINPPDSLH